MADVSTSVDDAMEIDEESATVTSSEIDMHPEEQLNDNKPVVSPEHNEVEHEEYPHSEEESEAQEIGTDDVSGIRVQDIPLPDYSPPAMQHSPPSSTVDTLHDNSSPLRHSPPSSTVDHQFSSSSSSQDDSIRMPEDSPPLPADTPTLCSSSSSSSQNTSSVPTETPPFTADTSLVPYTSPSSSSSSSSSENTPPLPSGTPPLPSDTPPLLSGSPLSPKHPVDTPLPSESPTSSNYHANPSPLPSETPPLPSDSPPLPSGIPLSPTHPADTSLEASTPTLVSNTPPPTAKSPVNLDEDDTGTRYNEDENVISDNEENMDGDEIASPQSEAFADEHSPQREEFAAKQADADAPDAASPQRETVAGEEAVSPVGGETFTDQTSSVEETYHVPEYEDKQESGENEVENMDHEMMEEENADDSLVVLSESSKPYDNENKASPDAEMTSCTDLSPSSEHVETSAAGSNYIDEVATDKSGSVDEMESSTVPSPSEERKSIQESVSDELKEMAESHNEEHKDSEESLAEEHKNEAESPSEEHKRKDENLIVEPKHLEEHEEDINVPPQVAEVKEKSAEVAEKLATVADEDVAMTCKEEPQHMEVTEPSIQLAAPTSTRKKTKKKKVMRQELSDDEDGFHGFDGEEIVGPVTLDFANLNFTQEEIDAVNIMNLEADWWRNPYLHRADSESSLDSASIVGDIIPSSAASVTSAASSPSSQMSGASSKRRSFSGKPRNAPSVSNPAFKKPFQFGFKREIVFRCTVDGRANNRGMADVYYYAPDGRKFRSNREIADYLDGRDVKLTTNNFTFAREPIGMNDPDIEIVREAKKKLDSGAGTGKRTAKPAVEKVIPLKVPKLKISTKSLTSPMSVEANSSETGIKLVPPLRISTVKGNRRSPSTGKAKGAAAKAKAGTARPDGSATKSAMLPCSISCVNAAGLIPSLQCTVCVCLYHPVCVGLSQATSQLITRYTCPNCREEQTTPALLPAAPPSCSLLLPQLQRLPRPGETNTVTLTPTMPMLQRFMQAPAPETVNAAAGGKIIYSLGAWRPPPPTIIRANMEQVAPQSLALMNGKKYIVIPKNNAMNASSVSPDSADTLDANKPFSPPPMSVLSQSPLLLPTPLTPTTTILPKGSILVNQPAGPGTPGGMFLMTPAENQDHATPQFMLVNSTGATPGMPTLLAATPSTSAGLPRMAEEGAAVERNIHIVGKKPIALSGGYTFTEKLSAMYDSLLGVFRYLTVQELLRASRVCRVWRQVAQHESLWMTVRMKNSRVSSWSGCISAVVGKKTTHLDLRKMLLPKREEEAQTMWSEFCGALQQVGSSLERIDLCRCPSSVVATVADSCPHLQQLCATAITVKSDNLDLKSIGNLKELRGLRLKSFHGMGLGNFQQLSSVSNLQQLSLTSVRMLPALEVAAALSALPNLELLELGDCPGLLSHASLVAKALGHLTHLQRLRLEKLVTDDSSERDSVREILKACSSLPKLSHLELINIEAGPGCDQAITACTKLRKILLVPSYISHGARTCQLMLRGILNLKDLEIFVWIVTNEVIGVTRKLMKTKQVSNISVMSENEECIPLLTPIPNASSKSSPMDEKKSSMKLDKLEILPLTKLKAILNEGLPVAKVSVTKAAFQATWRQTLCDWDL